MRYRKDSDRALDFELDRMWRKMRSAHYVQTGGRRTILTLALATAIFLPLADQGLPSNATPGGDTEDSNPINITTTGPNRITFFGGTSTNDIDGPTENEFINGSVTNNFTAPNTNNTITGRYNTTVINGETSTNEIEGEYNHNTINSTSSESTFEGDNHYGIPRPDDRDVIVNVSVNAAGLHVLSTAAPSQWHRATFGSADDVFWAIPDKDLTITRMTPAVNCTEDQCAADFQVRSDDYAVPQGANGPDLLSFQNALINTPIGQLDGRLVPSFATRPPTCEFMQLPNSRTRVLECRFVYIGRSTIPAAPRQDLCMQLKRSSIIEETGQAALDIRWDYVTQIDTDPAGAPVFGCQIARFPNPDIGIQP